MLPPTIHSRQIYILILFLFLGISSSAQNITQCDSVIELGVNALQRKDNAKSIEYLLIAQNMAESEGWYRQLFISTNAIGQNYYNLLRYGEALNYFAECYTIANKQLDAGSKVTALTNIGNVYLKEKFFEKAKMHYLEALEIAGENNMPVVEGELYIALANVENKLGNLDIARKTILKSLDLLIKNPEKLFAAKIILAENELLSGRTSRARALAQELLASGHKNDNDILLQIVITKSFFKEKRLNEAVISAHTALTLQPGLELKRDIFEILSNIYYAKSSYEEAFQYKDSIIKVNSALGSIESGGLLKNSMLAFENKYYKDELASTEQKANAERKVGYFILILIIIGFTAYLLRLRKRKLIIEEKYKTLLQEAARVKNNVLLLEKQLKEQGDITILQQERLKNELDSLKRKSLTQALFTSSRNNLLENVIASLLQRPALVKDKTLLSQIEMLKNNVNKENEWETFIAVFEDINQGILQRIKQQHPVLTQNDMRFLAYIHMNLSIKEIASILNITPESCRKRKERIALKMDMPEKSNLYDYILTI